MFWQIFISTLEVLAATATLIFGLFGIVKDTSLKDGKMTSNRRIALYGVLISGAITLCIKITQGVTNYENKKREAKVLETKNIELKRKDRLEQVHKDSVTKALNISLKSLKELSEGGKTSLENLRNITILQKRSTITQNRVLFNTQRTLTPLKPLTIGVTYLIEMSKLPVDNNPLASIVNYFENLLLIKKSLEQNTYTGRKDFVSSNVPASRNAIESFTIEKGTSLFPTFGDWFFDYLHNDFTVNILDSATTSKTPSTLPGLHFILNPRLEDSVYKKDFVHNSLEIKAIFSPTKAIKVRIITNNLFELGDRNKASSYSSILDLAGKSMLVQGKFNPNVKLLHVSLHTHNGAVTCLPFQQENLFRPKGIAYYYYQRKINENELQKSNCRF